MRIFVKTGILDCIATDSGKQPERWGMVEEAYIHCSKHIPQLSRQDKTIFWGTDDMKLKGGNFFHVQKTKESGE